MSATNVALVQWLWGDIPPVPELPGTRIPLPTAVQLVTFGVALSVALLLLGRAALRSSGAWRGRSLRLALAVLAASLAAAAWSAFAYRSARLNYRGGGPVASPPRLPVEQPPEASPEPLPDEPAAGD